MNLSDIWYYVPESARRRFTGGMLILGALGWFIAGYLYGCPAKAHAASPCCSSGICAEQGHHAASPAQYRHNGPALLNDPVVTPGIVTGATKEQICGVKWGKDARHVTASMKDVSCALYGLKPHCYGRQTNEIDHLIPRELAGADDLKNIWPQPYNQNPGAHQKDQTENFLHKQVCSGAMELEDAQQQIAQDWYAVYLKMPKDTR